MVDKSSIDKDAFIKQNKEFSKIKEIKGCKHISTFIDTELFSNPVIGDPVDRTVEGGGYIQEKGLIKDDDVVKHEDTGALFQKSGAKLLCAHDYKTTTAAILTCGGICPGLNVVIRELYMSLHYNYKVDKVYGIKGGYQGIYTNTKDNYVLLDNKIVGDIHKKGGTILGSSRGGFDLDKIVAALVDNKITMLFVIGGDGTHKGAQKIADECERLKLKISVCGIPKTIDNDIPIIDRTFGFETAVSEAVNVIDCANNEATSAINGIGIVKLFGRSCGFITMYAALASRDVNICLIPEKKFDLFGEKGLFEYVLTRVQKRNHCVIIVAEGCEDSINDFKVVDTGLVDKSGNKKLNDVGVIIKEELSKYAKTKNIEITIKYIDPTYIIRACASNAFDTHYCALLARNAVHSAFAGYTNFTSGCVNRKPVIIPLDYINSLGLRTIDTESDGNYLSMLGSTGQPDFTNKKKI